jgi:hypothetical protein
MGCKGSKTNKPAGAFPPEAAAFMRLVNDAHHPVARKILEEWSIFVDAQNRLKHGDVSAEQRNATRPREVWADTTDEPVTHRSVDEVGKHFVDYLKHDLLVRGWGGDFNYTVAGVAKQGYILVAAAIDVSSSAERDEKKWDIRVNYYCSGAQ